MGVFVAPLLRTSSVQFSWVAQLCPTPCDPMDCSTPGSPVLHYPPEPAHSHPFNHRCHPTILSSVVPFSSCFQSFPASGSFPMSWLFASFGQSIGASTSASVLPMNIQDWFPFGLTGGSPCSPRDSQESSPTLQFKSINSSGFSFLYSPTLTFIHDYWKNHSFDWTDLCWQSNVFAFQYAI